MKYPEEVVTISKAGKKEARILKERGKYVIYEYQDIETSRKENKVKLALLSSEGKRKEFFLIPLKQQNKYLCLEIEEIKEGIKVWNPKTKKAENLF